MLVGMVNAESWSLRGAATKQGDADDQPRKTDPKEQRQAYHQQARHAPSRVRGQATTGADDDQGLQGEQQAASDHRPSSSAQRLTGVTTAYLK